MSPGLLRRLREQARRRALVDAAFTAYAQWRNECGAVWAAYRRWIGAGATEAAFAFIVYNDALDREERAAERYARLISGAGQIPETALFPQRAHIEIS